MPRKPTLPRFGSVCLVDWHSAGSLPSNLRSKSGVASVTSPPDPTFARQPFVEQLEDSRLGAFADQTVAADGRRLIAGQDAEGGLGSASGF